MAKLEGAPTIPTDWDGKTAEDDKSVPKDERGKSKAEIRKGKPIPEGMAVVLFRAHYGVHQGGDRAMITQEECEIEGKKPEAKQRFTVLNTGRTPKKNKDGTPTNQKNNLRRLRLGPGV